MQGHGRGHALSSTGHWCLPSCLRGPCTAPGTCGAWHQEPQEEGCCGPGSHSFPLGVAGRCGVCGVCVFSGRGGGKTLETGLLAAVSLKWAVDVRWASGPCVGACGLIRRACLEGSERCGPRSDYRDAGRCARSRRGCWLEARHPIFGVPGGGRLVPGRSRLPGSPSCVAAP